VTFSDFIGLEIDASGKGDGGGAGKKGGLLTSSSSTDSSDFSATDASHSWDLHHHVAQDYLVI
jgi:hypothetical protein